MTTPTKLFTFWIFVLLNYIYGDILTLMNPEDLKAILSGKAGNIPLTPGFLLGAAMFTETAILMVVLCRLLPPKANRWTNFTAGLLHIASVCSTMFMGTTPSPAYIFLSAMELAGLSLIVRCAWKWSDAARPSGA